MRIAHLVRSVAVLLTMGGPAAAEAPFTVDPSSPRVLHPTRPGIITRDYVEAMARPRLPTTAHDLSSELFTSAPTPVQGPGENYEPSALAATGPVGDILVFEGNSNIVGNVQGGGLGFNHNGGLNEVLNLVLSNYGDEYDFITVFTTFDDNSVAAYYLPLQQNTDGLGECNFNNGDTFGCLFNQFGDSGIERLQGFVFMNSLNTWRSQDQFYTGVVHDDDDQLGTVFATLGQEVGHRWGAGLRFIDPLTGRTSKQLLGRDNSHWAAYVDTDASIMDGWDWEENGEDFTLVAAMQGFSTLDLYAMGALPVAAAKPLYIIDNARFIAPGTQFNGQPIPADAVLQVPYPDYLAAQGLSLGATGTRIDVNVQDIVDAEGNRCPDPDHTQRAFRQAIVLVTRPGQTASQASVAISELTTVMDTWEQYWLDKTNKRLRICTQLVGDCVAARR
jgi:hypothetical protein